jgi:hypothetical protein
MATVRTSDMGATLTLSPEILGGIYLKKMFKFR